MYTSHLDDYLHAKRHAWQPSTLNSEEPRLRAALREMHNSWSPAQLLDVMSKTHKPYSIKTTFVRMAAFEAWLIEGGMKPAPNKFAAFSRTHANLFKRAYQKELLPDGITFQEAERRIRSEIQDPSIKRKALELLYSGCRYKESGTAPIGRVWGKGGKLRAVFLPTTVTREGPPFKNSYQTFRRALARVGLKPHTLRKLSATEFARNGGREAELCEAYGWTSFTTASRYVQPLREAERLAIMEKAWTKRGAA